METKPYLIALDLDGTLLKDDKTISPETARTIQTLKEAGHHVCISTGRPFRSSSMYYDELGLTTPIVNFNGHLSTTRKTSHGDDTTRPYLSMWSDSLPNLQRPIKYIMCSLRSLMMCTSIIMMSI